MTERNPRLSEVLTMLDPVEQLIFQGGIAAIVRKRVTAEQAMQDVHRLVDRYRAGKRVLVSDFPVEWMYSGGEHE